MPVASGELQQVTLVMLQDGQTVENVFMFREVDGTVTDEDVAQAVKDFWDIYRTQICDDVLLTELRAKRMTPTQLDPLVFHANTGNDLGGLGGDLINTMLAAVTTHRTGTAGKRHRGRTYSPGVTISHTTDQFNRLTSQALTDYATMWAAVDTEFSDALGTNAALRFGIYSRLIGGTLPYTVAGWQAVSQHVTHAILGTQRRRRIGVGV